MGVTGRSAAPPRSPKLLGLEMVLELLEARLCVWTGMCFSYGYAAHFLVSWFREGVLAAHLKEMRPRETEPFYGGKACFSPRELLATGNMSAALAFETALRTRGYISFEALLHGGLF